MLISIIISQINVNEKEAGRHKSPAPVIKIESFSSFCEEFPPQGTRRIIWRRCF